MKIAFCTYISDCYFHSIGAAKLLASLRYFHPNIPIICYGDTAIKEEGMDFGLLHPFMINRVMEQGYDAVIYFDADSIVTGSLDELLLALENSYDIICVRNNNDQDKAGMDEPIGQEGAGTEHYVNAGLIAVKNKNFLKEWMEDNKKYGAWLPFKEQTVLNTIKGKYKSLIIDNKDTNVYYGVSCLSGTESHWDSWKEIHVMNGDLMLNYKKIKVLHHAGGKKEDKLGFYMFNDETRKRLIEITGL